MPQCIYSFEHPRSWLPRLVLAECDAILLEITHVITDQKRLFDQFIPSETFQICCICFKDTRLTDIYVISFFFDCLKLRTISCRWDILVSKFGQKPNRNRPWYSRGLLRGHFESDFGSSHSGLFVSTRDTFGRDRRLSRMQIGLQMLQFASRILSAHVCHCYF